MRHAESPFANSTHRAGADQQIAGAPVGNRLAMRFSLLAILVASFLALAVSPAWGAYLHTTVTGEYGKEGPKSTGVGSGCRLAYQSANHRLYLFSDSEIYGLNRTAPGTVVPLGGFPFPAVNSSCSDPGFDVDNSSGASKNNLYAVPSSHLIYGWNSAGSQLATPWPVDAGGETCGVAVANNGEVWGGNYGLGQITKFTAAGVLTGSIPVPFTACKLAIDQTNNDLYVQPYSSSAGVVKYTAASGYTTSLTFPPSGSSNAGLAVNGLQHRLYVGNGSSQVKSYDTESGSLVETIELGESGGMGIAVDEPTDTLFVTVGSGASGVIKEITGAVVPDVKTEEPIGNSKVGGKVELSGGGEITECFFEFGTSPTPPYANQESCSPSTPYLADQNVTAELPGLLGEQTYYYRLVARNANGKNAGGVKTITPHYVEALQTDEAENITRNGAKLKAHFNGNGEETTYYFEWGTEAGVYGTQSAIPPGTSAGSPVGPTSISFEAFGLEPDILYHYRVVATNPKGVSPGGDKTFKTLPAVQSLTTTAATSVAPKAATLNGSYTGDGTPTTYKFEYGTSSYISSTPVQSAGSPTGTTPLSVGISALNLETLYHYRVVATNSLGTTYGADETFTTKKAVIDLTTLPAAEISQAGVKLKGEYQGSEQETHYYFEYGPTTSYGMLSEAPPGSVVAAGTGPTLLSTTIDQFEGWTTYHYRVAASNSVGTSYGQDQTFTTLPAPLPEVSEAAASDVTRTGAMLSARINPNRWPTVYRFEWGPTTSYGSKTKLSDVIAGLDNQGQPVSSEIGSLLPATVYHFRVIAINFTGVTYEPDHTFITPDAPVIESTGSSAIGQASAHLTARVIGNSSPTRVHFEFGPTNAYGTSTASTQIGEELVARGADADITGLDPSRTYHFRVVASNGIGTTYGPDQTLTTSARASGGPGSGQDCKGLSEQAKKLKGRAARLRQRATDSRDAVQAQKLRQRAKSAAKKARKLSQQASACKLAAGGSA